MKTKFFYVGIRVKDLHQSINFYVNILGMNLKARYKIEETKGDIDVLIGDDNSFSLELNFYKNNSPFNTPYVLGEGLDHLAFKVDNLDNALLEAKR